MNALVGNAALESWLRGALKADAVSVERAERLSGGAIQESWGLDVRADGTLLPLVLRRDADGTIEASRSRKQEHEVVSAAFAAGVAVPRPVAFCEDERVAGRPFALVERVSGVGYGPKIVREVPESGRGSLHRSCGRTCRARSRSGIRCRRPIR